MKKLTFTLMLVAFMAFADNLCESNQVLAANDACNTAYIINNNSATENETPASRLKAGLGSIGGIKVKDISIGGERYWQLNLGEPFTFDRHKNKYQYSVSDIAWVLGTTVDNIKNTSIRVAAIMFKDSVMGDQWLAPEARRKIAIQNLFTILQHNTITSSGIRSWSNGAYMVSDMYLFVKESDISALSSQQSDQEAQQMEKKQYAIENVQFAQNLKTYTGPYKMSGRNGIAIYQYRDAPDGSRIFEGKFEFSEEGKCKVEGYFKDDYQVGQWVWKYFSSYTGKEQYVYKVLFDENGRLYGKFNIWNCSGEIKNGEIVSVSYDFDGEGVGIGGKFKNKKPIGIWNVAYSGSKKGWHNITMEYDSYGNFIKGGYRDNSTGDWIKGYEGAVDKVYYKVITGLTEYYLRSTGKITLPINKY